MPSQNFNIGGACAPASSFFFILLFLGTNGAIAKFQQRGELELLFLLLLDALGCHCQDSA